MTEKLKKIRSTRDRDSRLSLDALSAGNGITGDFGSGVLVQMFLGLALVFPRVGAHITLTVIR